MSQKSGISLDGSSPIPTSSGGVRSPRRTSGRSRVGLPKSVGVVAGVGLLVLALAACSSSANTSTKTNSSSGGDGIKIVMVGCTLTDPFCSAWKRGADDAAKQVGVSETYIGADVTAAGLSQALQTATATNPDGIAAGDWFPSTEDPLLQKAASSGTSVILVNAAAANWQSLSWSIGLVGQNDQDAGVVAGQEMVTAGAKHVLCVNHETGSAQGIARCDGVSQAVKAAGGTATVLNIPYADVSNPSAITQDVGGALSSDKSIDGVVTLGAGVAQNVIQLLNGNTKIKVGTFDLSTSVLNSIKAGKAEFAINQQPYLQGYNAVLALYTHIKYGIHPVGQIATGPEVVDKSNVGKLLQVNQKYPGILGAA